MKTFACLLTLVATVLSQQAVYACGGVFCSSTNPIPVEQEGERIIFDVHPDDRITTHVQISYAGNPQRFSWIVPLPNVPEEVAESDIAMFNTLDNASRPQVLMPFPSCGGGGGGCAFNSSDAASDSGPAATDINVVVHSQSFTENYEYVVLETENSADLIEWLQTNDYTVGENMLPAITPYARGGSVFLAVKLRAGRLTQDIVPLQFTYDAQVPGIPLGLTRVAAQPQMGVVVMILSEDRFVPSNMEWVVPSAEDLVYDGQQTNYTAWVSRQVAEAEGKKMVAEYIGRNPLLNNGDGQRMLSRFYTRLNPEHMTTDPVFEKLPESDNTDVTSFLDLSAEPTVSRCDGSAIEARLPSRCAFNYCGLGATCVEQNDSFGCECPRGSVAQSIAGPAGQRTVTCTPEDNPLGVQTGAGADTTTCGNMNCGRGTCQDKSGFPVCVCDADANAQIVNGQTQCIPRLPFAAVYGPGGGVESRSLWLFIERSRLGMTLPIPGGLLLFAGLLFRRRRR